ncbi:ATP synthase subunit I [Vibrio gallicus]|uniref:ATP synthase subunit I n=1 Tax=Vibrio gallicus TaxID=190897 RepID=UPI0021C3CB03|nr:ATP synthase subunit I [Vibrio gallicus]
MKLDSANTSIIVAAKRVFLCQIVLAVGVVLYEVVFGNELGLKSALVGSAIAIIPALLGFYYSSLKVQRNPDYSLRDLMKMSRVVKLIYTFVAFIIAFKVLNLDNPVIIEAYIVTMIGHFLTPFIADSQSEYA